VTLPTPRSHMEALPATGTLRVAVVVDGTTVPRWIAETIADIDRRGWLAALSVEPAPGGDEPAAWRLYERLDAALCRSEDDGVAPVSLPDVPRRASADRSALPPPVDVVLDLRTRPEPGASNAPLGTWWVAMGEGGGGLRPAFAGRTPVAPIVLRARIGEHELSAPLAWTSLDLNSLGRSRSAFGWKARWLIGRALERLARGEVPADAAAEPADRSGRDGSGRVPSLLAGLGVRFARTRARRLLGRHQWFVAIRPRRPDRPGTDTTGFTPIFPPADRYWADPFLFRHRGESHLFFEELRDDRGRGEILWARLDERGRMERPEVVLAGDGHFAYPFVFELGGTIYMLPDNGGAGGVQLWRAAEYPRRWEPAGTLVPDVRAVDATLLRHDGRLWLFVAVAAEHAPDFDELWLWHAERLHGPWQPHHGNPVVADTRRARPAGAIVRWNDQWIRPSQDGSTTYGGALVFNVIERLDTESYRERPAWRLDPTWRPGLNATHTWNADECFEVIDGQRWIPRLFR